MSQLVFSSSRKLIIKFYSSFLKKLNKTDNLNKNVQTRKVST